MKINKKINMDRLPAHVAFIMDGNGRWAKARAMPRQLGHHAGYKALTTTIKRCAEIGIKVVSVYAFSTENWNRPQPELDEIFKIVRDNFHKDIPLFMEHGIRVIASGDTTRFPLDLQNNLAEVINKTKDNTRCTLNLCINYGGRADIVQAVNKVMHERTVISEKEFAKHLYNSHLPDPDLVVRTSGEQRISNFMLWQMAYSELLFLDEYWPSMDERLVDHCIIEFQKRLRRFGRV